MILHSGSITGAGAVVRLSTLIPQLSGQVAGGQLWGKFVQLATPPTNSGDVLIGGSEVSSTVGFHIPKGWAGQMLPTVADPSDFYDLSNIFVYIANNDVLYVLYGG